jgi:hypothetical protein
MTEDLFDPNRGGQDINNYPAFKWCIEHGEGWFMPSSTELQWLWDTASGGTHNYDSEAMKAFNKAITDNGGTAISEDYYMSSNETSTDIIEVVAFMADSIVCLEKQKTQKFSVRAAYRIQLN